MQSSAFLENLPRQRIAAYIFQSFPSIGIEP
jgi:hypothetical protein